MRKSKSMSMTVATLIIIFSHSALNACETVSFESVIRAMAGKPKPFLVDVRPAAEFGHLRIPGSINIPLHFLKTKSFLKGSRAVLTNSGFVLGPLEAECRRLTQAGFTLSVLSGGLYAWTRAGGKLEGDPFAPTELNKITPADFHAERHAKNRIIIDVSATETQESKAFVPGAIRLSVKENTAEWIGEFKKIAKEYSRFPLIFNQNGTGYGKLEKPLRDSNAGAFFLKGGLDAYRKYVNTLAAMKSPGQETVRKTGGGGCKPCGNDN